MAEINMTLQVSADPKERVFALEVATRAICEHTGQDPAEGVMMLLTAAAHMFSTYSEKRPAVAINDLAHALGAATVAAEGFCTPHIVKKAGGRRNG